MASQSICIRTNNLTKRFALITAVNNLNLEVPTGSRFGFLGPNGAGKTTTVRLLSGLITPTEGSAEVCGLDLKSHRDKIKEITGLLPDSPGIFSKLSAVEFLEFVSALKQQTGPNVHQRIDQLLGILGLETRRDDLLESYSSGMKQKVLIASTLIHNPKLVFLDEPTSRLDPAAAALVKDLILVLAEETNTSFFICTHQTSFAEEVCDSIGILNAGALILQGSPQMILQQTRSSDLEDAYLKLIGRTLNRETLLAWRQ